MNNLTVLSPQYYNEEQTISCEIPTYANYEHSSEKVQPFLHSESIRAKYAPSSPLGVDGKWAHVDVDVTSSHLAYSIIYLPATGRQHNDYVVLPDDKLIQQNLTKAIIDEYKQLSAKGIVVSKILSSKEDGATIYFIVIDWPKIELAWYKYFADIELKLNSHFVIDAIGFRHISVSLEESGIIPEPNEIIFDHAR